jgi:hypothetical protein
VTPWSSSDHHKYHEQDTEQAFTNLPPAAARIVAHILEPFRAYRLQVTLMQRLTKELGGA